MISKTMKILFLFYCFSNELITGLELLSSESESSEEILINAHKYCKQKTGASDCMYRFKSSKNDLFKPN